MSGSPALLSRYMNIEAGMGGISRKRRFQILVSVHNRSITPTFILDCRHKNVHSKVRKKACLAHSSDSYFMVIDPKLHSWIIIGRVVLTLTIHIVSLEENIPFLQLKLSVSCDSFFVGQSHCCITMPPPAPVRELTLIIGKQDSHLHCLFTERLLQSFMSWTITMHEVQYLKRKKQLPQKSPFWGAYAQRRHGVMLKGMVGNMETVTKWCITYRSNKT